MHLYHCHATPLKKHIHKGLYGAFIIDPPKPRKPAQEFVMVMNGFDTDGDGENNVYAVNGPAFYYAKYPIRVSKSQTVRIYLANLTEFDLINSFHLHGDFFRYYATGRDELVEYTDTVMLTQGQRGIIEIDFANTGQFMFHAHQSEFAGARLDGLLRRARMTTLARRRQEGTPGACGRSCRCSCSSPSSRSSAPRGAPSPTCSAARLRPRTSSRSAASSSSRARSASGSPTRSPRT